MREKMSQLEIELLDYVVGKTEMGAGLYESFRMFAKERSYKVDAIRYFWYKRNGGIVEAAFKSEGNRLNRGKHYRKHTVDEKINAANLLKAHTRAEVSKMTGIPSGSLAKIKKDYSNRIEDNASEESRSMEEMRSHMEQMQREIIRYVDESAKSVSRELSGVSNMIQLQLKPLRENLLSSRDDNKLSLVTVNGTGEVERVKTNKEISYNEEKVSALISYTETLEGTVKKKTDELKDLTKAIEELKKENLDIKNRSVLKRLINA